MQRRCHRGRIQFRYWIQPRTGGHLPQGERRTRSIIAASFSQTYLRNAYNNGFLCIEVPVLVKRLREEFASNIAGKEKTIIPGEIMEIDFTSCTVAWRGERFIFPPLGNVPQSLVIAGGAENMVAKKLG